MQTATGTIAADDLGATLVDEHVLRAPAGYRYWPGEDEQAVLDQCAAALRALSGAGIDAIVDTTTIEGGRDVELIRRASEAAGLAVVCSTGVDAASDGVAQAFRSLPAPRLADVFVTELAEGVPGAGVRAGALTVAFGTPDSFDDVALLAVAFAHAETGAPVLLQAPPAQAEARVDALLAHGVDPERIVVRGVDAPETTFAVVDGLARRGVGLGFTDGGLDERARAALFAYALRRYGPGRLSVGTGAAARELHVPGASRPESEPAPPDERFRRFAARVEEYGISGDELREALASAPLFTPPAELIDA